MLIRGSLRPPGSLHRHQVPNYNTLLPPCLFNSFFALSEFDFKFASSWESSHLGLPTPTCWFTTLHLLPHTSVSFCATMYSCIYVVSIIRVLVVLCPPVSHKLFKDRGFCKVGSELRAGPEHMKLLAGFMIWQCLDHHQVIQTTPSQTGNKGHLIPGGPLGSVGNQTPQT